LSERLHEDATLGPDKNYDALGVRRRPEGVRDGAVATRDGEQDRPAEPGAVVASPGYSLSQRQRTRIEECFGWSKTVRGLTQLKLRGSRRRPVSAKKAFVSLGERPFAKTSRNRADRI